MYYLIISTLIALAGLGTWLSVPFLEAPASPPPVVEEITVGAALPSATAVFETSLASPISSSATSMTLTANAVRGGGSLSGYNCFTVDEGSAQAETICGTVSGTSVTSLTRGISQATGTTTVAALQFAHRRGASVKITDFPLIQILKAQNNGEDTFPRSLIYDSAVGTTSASFPSAYSIPNRGYIDAAILAPGSVIGATETASGFVELATGAEAAATTLSGSIARLALSAAIATSTYNSATAANVIPVTKGTGFIDQGFLPTTISKSISYTGSNAYTSGINVFATSSIYVGDFPAYHIGKQIQVFSSTGTTTFSVPSGITKVKVTTVGAGGGGGSADAGGTDEASGGGAGAGGCAIENVDVSGTSTIQVFIGAAGAGVAGAVGANGGWSTFGTNGFYNSATGGTGGGFQDDPFAGTSGTGAGGTINLQGTLPGMGSVSNSAGVAVPGGLGGVSCMAGTYGFGGKGALSVNGGAATGATGGNGVVIVEW